MRTSPIVWIAGGLILAVTLRCAAAGERHTAQSCRSESAVPKQPTLETLLPYCGYGTVTLLNNGALIVEIGGEDRGPGLTPTFSEVIGFDLDTRGLSLVNHNGVHFLDWNGAQIAARGLNPAEVRITKLDEPVYEIDRGTSRYAVFVLSGTLDFTFDHGTGWSIGVTDQENPRISFDHQVTGKASAGIFNDPSASGQREGPHRMTCSVTCEHGWCEVSCGPTCDAWCSPGGLPVCVCYHGVSE